MVLIEEFVEKVLNDNGSFIIVINEKKEEKTYCQFMQRNVGKARYVYGMKTWSEISLSDINRAPSLVAIISDGIVYVIDEYFLLISTGYNKEKNQLPKNMAIFHEIIKSQNEYVSNVVFANYYNDLEFNDVTERNSILECTIKARTNIFNGRTVITKGPELFNERDIARTLCGIIDIDTEARNRLEENREVWVRLKSENKKIESLMNEPETALEWERSIAAGLNMVDAKKVIVEFEMNNKHEKGKISPKTIIQKLTEKDNFAYYDFETQVEGEKVISSLGAGSRWTGNPLTCEHIVRITYGKKELYVRKE